MHGRASIVGRRGQWTARVNGRDLAVPHHPIRRDRPDHVEPYDPACLYGAEYPGPAEALHAHDDAVMQRDRSADDLSRDEDAEVFRFGTPRISDDGLIESLITGRTG